MFYHSLVSDWNHGNAHFLRGIASELIARGHEVRVFEPRRGWSLGNLLADQGTRVLAEFHRRYPDITSQFYDLENDDPAALAQGADLVIVHEWNEPELVRRLGEYRAAQPHCRLLFHDTHHRSVTEPAAMARYDLRHYDGVLAFGAVIKELYLAHGWTQRAWVWHEAADARVFYPRAAVGERRDLVWIGNWGDGERSAELHEFLVEPIAALGLSASVYGVRYPADALHGLARAGADYGGWIANYAVPEVFARHRVTLHVPRRPYVEALPGIPTIRPFEALACGIPLVSAPWRDDEGLFTPGEDFLVARDGTEMRRHLRALLADADMAAELAARGRRTVLRRHTCAQRVDELAAIVAELGLSMDHHAEETSDRHETGTRHRLLRF